MFSASDAAFSGFRAGREHFMALVIWIVVFGAAAIGLMAAAVPVLGPVLVELNGLNDQSNPDPRVVLALVRRLMTAASPLIVPMLILAAVQSAAINRMMLRPGDSAFGYLRLGGDEVRQFLVTLLLALVLLALEVAGVVVVAVLSGLAATINPGLAVLVSVLGGVIFIAALILVAVRLSLAKSQTFATGRINLFGSWKLTRGRFWPMIGAYLLAFVLFVITSMAVKAIAMLAVFLGGGGFAGVGAVQSPDFSSLAALLTVPMMINLAINLAANPFMILILECPAPAIYRALAGSNGADETIA